MAVTDFTLPKIDQYAARRVLAGRIMNNVTQQLIYRDGLGITEAFSDNVMAAQVRIIRQKLPTQTSRKLGDGQGYNDGHFNVLTAEQPITYEYDLPLLEMYDRNIDIADVLDDMIQIGTLNITIKTLEQRLTQLINAYTMAAKVGAALNYSYETDKTGDPTLIAWTVASQTLLSKLAEAHAKLDDGSITHGIDTFPFENRIVLTNTKAKQTLLTAENAVVDIGSSRAVQLVEIGSTGGLEPAKINTDTSGYYGTIYGTPMHFAPKILWKLTEEYLGLSAGDLDKVTAIVSASQATGRGIAFQNSVKIIDNPRGQGLRLQPKTRWGVKVWIPEGIQLIVEHDFSNPVVSDETTLEAVGPDGSE